MLNKVINNARVGKKEIKKLGDKSYITLSLATNIYDYSKKENKTIWYFGNVFGKTAEYVNKYINIGDIVSIDGFLDNYIKDEHTVLQVGINSIELVAHKQEKKEDKENGKEELQF